MLNYYHRYLPSVSSVLEPLHKLLRKQVKWVSQPEHQESFEKAKQLLCSASILVHYNQDEELILHCDASPYGVGAVLLHIMEDYSEKPIAYMSRTLYAAERNYSQIEKETLAIVSAVKKFHQYLGSLLCSPITNHFWDCCQS